MSEKARGGVQRQKWCAIGLALSSLTWNALREGAKLEISDEMQTCGSCGGDLVRVRRKFLEKFIYYAILECRKCGAREKHDEWYLFLFGRTSRCPRCGTVRVEKLLGIDRIDPMYKNPLSYVQKWFGASIHWCPACRLQFYDLRKRSPSAKRSPSRLSF
jgi:hypothetical protein